MVGRGGSVCFSNSLSCSPDGKRDAAAVGYAQQRTIPLIRLITVVIWFLFCFFNSLIQRFNPKPKINSPPPTNPLNYIPPTAPCYWLSLQGPLYVVTLQRKYSFWMFQTHQR